jgi:serine/threonine-protein kinase
VAAAGLVAVTAALWGVTSHSPASGGIDQPTEARMGAETPPPCRVTYALRTDSGKDFAAELTLTNVGKRELRDWRLSFTFPSQQTVTKATPVPVRQQGRTVLVEPAPERAALAPGASEKLTLTGRHGGANPLPLEFRLGDEACGAQVSGVAGAAPSVAPTKAPVKAPVKAPTVKAPAKKAGTSAGSSGGSKAKPDNSGKGKGKAGGGKKVSQETERERDTERDDDDDDD